MHRSMKSMDYRKIITIYSRTLIFLNIHHLTQRLRDTSHNASPESAPSNYGNLQCAHVIITRWTKEWN